MAGKNGVSRTGNINTDYQAWTPRISFAYQLNRKTIIRSGYGLFYFPQGNAGTNIRQFRQPPYDFVVNLPFSGNDIPAHNDVARLSRSSLLLRISSRGPALFALKGVTPDYRNGQMQQFNVTVQREIGATWWRRSGFVSSAGAKLYWARNINLPDPGPGAIDPRRPYYSLLPGVTGITWLESSGNSFFSSMQASLEKRFSGGLYFLGNWTWSHSLDNVGGDGGANGPVPQDPRNRRADWASSNSDVRHRVNLAATYLLPFGPGRPYANGGGAWDRSSVVGRSAESPCCKAVFLIPSPCRVRHPIPVMPAAPTPFRVRIQNRLTRASTCGSIQRPSLHLRHLHGERWDEIR